MKQKIIKLTSDERVRSLVVKSILAFTVKVGSAVLSFAMFVLLARVMGKESYGTFGAAFSLATFLAIAGSFGQRTLILRFSGIYDNPDKKQLLNGVIKNGYLFVFSGCLALGVAGIVWSALNNQGVPSPISIAVCGLTILIGLVEYQANVMRVLSSVLLALMPRDIIWRVVIVLAACLASVLAITATSPVAWVWFLVFSLIFICISQLWWFNLKYSEKSFSAPALYDRPTWFKAMWGLWFAAIVTRSIGSLSVVIIDKMLGPAEAAPFFAALRTAQLLNLFQIAASVICTPMISKEIGNENWGNVRKISCFAVLMSGGGAVLGWLFFYSFGVEVLSFFGPGFSSASTVLMIIGFGYVVSGLAGPTQPLLQMSGHDRPLLVMLIISNGIGLIIMPFATFHFGVSGAAMALAFGLSGWNILAWIYAKRVLKVDPTIFGLFTMFRSWSKS
jgi:O-antigen/teichoic acid export membrane protein